MGKKIIMTGDANIDDVMFGYRTGTLQIVGGRPAAGKTEYALKTAEALAINRNIPVLYFTLGDSIDTAKNHMKAICEDDEFLDGAQVFFEDKYFTVKDIEQVASKYIEMANVGFVIVDYLQLVKLDESFADREKIIRELRRFAESNEIPVLLLAMLNNEPSKRSGGGLVLTDFDNHECIMLNANKILMIERHERQMSYYFFSYTCDYPQGMLVYEGDKEKEELSKDRKEKTLYDLIDAQVMNTGCAPRIPELEYLEIMSAKVGIDHEQIRVDDLGVLSNLKDIVLMNDIPALDLKKQNMVSDFFVLYGVHGFEDLIKLLCVAASTNLWDGNLKSILENKTVNKNELFFCRQDVYEYLKVHNMPKEMAWHLSEEIRKGKLCHYSKEMLKIMRDYSIPDWYIDACQKTRYLVSRDVVMIRAIITWRLAYFKSYHPEVFEQVMHH